MPLHYLRNLILALVITVLSALVFVALRYNSITVSGTAEVLFQHQPLLARISNMKLSLDQARLLFEKDAAHGRVLLDDILVPLQALVVRAETIDGLLIAQNKGNDQRLSAQTKRIRGWFLSLGEVIPETYYEDEEQEVRRLVVGEISELRKRIRVLLKLSHEGRLTPPVTGELNGFANFVELLDSLINSYLEQDAVLEENIFVMLDSVGGGLRTIVDSKIGQPGAALLTHMTSLVNKLRTGIAGFYAHFNLDMNMSSLNAERIELIRTWETASLTLSEITRLLEKRIFTAQDKIYRSGQVQQVYLLGIFLLGLALIVSLLVVYTSVLQRRISALLAGTVQLAAGDRGFRVAPGAEDSLGQLAMSFNKMAEQLQAQDVQIELQMDELRRSRDEVTQVNKLLESRVKERTRNLEAVNQELLAQQEEERKLFRQLEETNNQLIHAEKMASVGQLAAGVAHEINNPIGFVRSNLSTLGDYAENLLSIINAYEESEGMLKDHAEVLNQLRALKEQADLDFIRKDINELIQESLGGADRITRIVQDLKSFSRVGTEEWEWADVQQGLESTLNVVWHDLKYQANVVKEYGNPPEIQCVLSQLNQVFMNILLNAGQAMDEHGTITIRTGSDDGQVWVQIEDTGHGIAKETRDKIFDPFFTTKSVGKGTGLGLSVSYGIVERHRGSIEVDSEPGKGTIFTIRLPIHATDAGDTPELVQASGRPN